MKYPQTSYVGAYCIRPEKHPRGLVGAFGHMRYAPTWQLGELRNPLDFL